MNVQIGSGRSRRKPLEQADADDRSTYALEAPKSARGDEVGPHACDRRAAEGPFSGMRNRVFEANGPNRLHVHEQSGSASRGRAQRPVLLSEARAPLSIN